MRVVVAPHHYAKNSIEYLRKDEKRNISAPADAETAKKVCHILNAKYSVEKKKRRRAETETLHMVCPNVSKITFFNMQRKSMTELLEEIQQASEKKIDHRLKHKEK